jgi:regulatory protein
MDDRKKEDTLHTLSNKEAKIKIYAYCAYQERTQKEARNKLYEYGLKTDEIEEIISDLISENFINEERFSITYTGGKFRIKKWGKIKIKEGLKLKGVSDYCLKVALASIDQEEYLHTLQHLLEKKEALEKEKNTFKKNEKLARYAISRGYEPEIVWSILKDKS